MKSEKLIHIPGSIVDSTIRAYSASESKNRRVCESMNKNPGLFKLIKLLYIGTLFFFVFSLIPLITSCNETFEPLIKDEAAFSIQGFLDTSIDTQWVRLTPLREQVSQPEFKPEMTVTLENLEGGEAVTMNDSLILNPNGFHYLNAWTPMNVEPNHSYRLKAERPDGAVSHITVTIPEDFPTPVLHFQEEGGVGNLRISGVERLADVQSRWKVRIVAPESGWDFERIFWIPYRRLTSEIAPGEYQVRINPQRDSWYIGNQIVQPPRGNLEIEIIRRQVYVASGGPEWNEEITSLEDLIYALPDIYSNIENGVGYFIGVNSKVIPYKSCYADDDRTELIACPEVKPIY